MDRPGTPDQHHRKTGVTLPIDGRSPCTFRDGLQMCAFHANILVLSGEGAIPVFVSIARAVKGEH